MNRKNSSELFGHPKGLYVLFLVEMWERFSYYGMRALLILYLTAPLTGMHGAPAGFNPGRGWTDAAGSTLYGWYTGLAYLFPILGGIIGDRLIGTHRSMVAGGLQIALGHIVLAISGMGGLATNQLGMSIFVLGLALVVVGTGHFKPCASVMVGQLYPAGDPRRDGAFSIFYMGINVGAFICAFVCGTLGERVGWHWGFGSASLGMIAGLIIYLAVRPRYLANVGLPPEGARNYTPALFVIGIAATVLFALAFHTGALSLVRHLMTTRFIVALSVAVIGLAIWFVLWQRPGERGPVASIFIYMFFNAFFWIAYEQTGSSLNLFTDRFTDRNFLGFEVPTTWFQSVNPLLIIVLAPVFGWLWTSLGKKNANPSQPIKIALGLFLLGGGYVFMTVAGRVTTHAGKASMAFLLITYLLHSMGELCISPTGLSYVTKVAPKRFVSLLMGIWFISSFLANLGGGLVAAQVEKIESGAIRMPWALGGQADFFFLFVATSLGACVVILALLPALKKLTLGKE